jgi:uncharacterized protein (TIGR02147 family)
MFTFYFFSGIFICMSPKHLSVLDFIDYRLYLTSFYQVTKKNVRGFSHRLMASRLGFTSPNFLKLVMDGNRNISKESLGKITKGLELNKQEAEYFSYLVFFAQAKNDIDKNYYFGLIAAMRGKKNVASLSPEQFEYFSEWYHPMVRELVSGCKEPLDYDAISRRLRVEVSAAKLRKSVALLLRLGLIKLNEENTYVHSAPLLNTQNELNSFAIRHYHTEVLDVAKKTLETVLPDKREFSHLTIKTSPEGFAKIKKRIQEFREEILQIVVEEPGADEICHVNFQLYPLVEGSGYESSH